MCGYETDEIEFLASQLVSELLEPQMGVFRAYGQFLATSDMRISLLDQYGLDRINSLFLALRTRDGFFGVCTYLHIWSFLGCTKMAQQWQ